MSSLALRKVNLAEHALEKYARITGKEVIQLGHDDQHNFVHIEAMLKGRVISLYCDAAKLLQACSPVADELPLELIDKSLYCGWISQYFSTHGLYMPVVSEEIKQFTVKGFVDNHLITYPLISMANSKDMLWVELKDIIAPDVPTGKNIVDWSALHLRMQINLGWSHVSYWELAKLMCGDVVLLTHIANFAVVNDKVVLRFSIKDENMIVESMEENDIPTNSEVTLIEENGISLDNMDLRVEFFLEDRTMTLAELQCLQPYDLLPLTISSSPVNVSLRVGKKIIASGELVRVDEKLAVEIHQLSGTA